MMDNFQTQKFMSRNIFKQYTANTSMCHLWTILETTIHVLHLEIKQEFNEVKLLSW